MNSRDLWKSALLVLGAVSIVVPASLVTASDGRAVAKETSVRLDGNATGEASVKIHDLSLGVSGDLTGYILDGQGKAVANSRVMIRGKQNSPVETVTDESGRFRVEGLRGGIYQIVHADGVSMFRVWKSGTAPKSAKANALIVTGRRQIRGQSQVSPFNFVSPGTMFAGGAAIAGTTLGIVGVSQASDANDDADAATAKLDALLSSIN
jgi:hypothetical protein